MSANPIGLAVIALAALAAGVVWAYNKFESFRNILKTVWDWIKKIAGYTPGGLLAKGIGLLTAAELPPGDPRRGDGTAAAGLYGGTAATVATPGLFGAPAPGVAGGSVSSTAGVMVGGDTYHITISGLLDDQAAADRIDKLLRRRGAIKGSTPTVEL